MLTQNYLNQLHDLVKQEKNQNWLNEVSKPQQISIFSLIVISASTSFKASVATQEVVTNKTASSNPNICCSLLFLILLGTLLLIKIHPYQNCKLQALKCQISQGECRTDQSLCQTQQLKLTLSSLNFKKTNYILNQDLSAWDKIRTKSQRSL